MTASWKGIARHVLDEAGATVGADGGIRLPCRNLAGEAVRERIVAPDGRRWWGPGEGVHLFGLEQLAGADPSTAVIVTEGESDQLAAREYLPDVIAVGCPGSCAWNSDWAGLFANFPLLYSIGDGDKAGRDFAWRVRRDIPWARPITCPLGTDLRELLQTNQMTTVEAMFANANMIAILEYRVLTAPDLASCCERLGSTALVDDEMVAAWRQAEASDETWVAPPPSTAGGTS